MPYRMMDVAEHAGVSITMVSHVINKTRYVSPEIHKAGRRAIANYVSAEMPGPDGSAVGEATSSG